MRSIIASLIAIGALGSLAACQKAPEDGNAVAANVTGIDPQTGTVERTGMNEQTGTVERSGPEEK